MNRILIDDQPNQLFCPRQRGFNSEDRWISPDDLSRAMREPVRNQALLDKALRFHPIADLFARAQETSYQVARCDLEIFAVPPHTMPKDGEVFLNPTTGKVQISIKANIDNDSAMTALIQELSNALFMKEAMQIFAQAREGALSESQFVNQMESTECQAMLVYGSVITALKREWHDVWGSFRRGFKDSSEYYSLQEKSGHSDLYRSLWKHCFSKNFNTLKT
jgi:hypothetical protein